MALLVMTGDRGSAGAFNANVLRTAIQAARELEAEGKERPAAGRRPARASARSAFAASEIDQRRGRA